MKLIDKDDYYKDSTFASFSGLKVFSRCERLYSDIFITKTYEEPEKDYFVYGKLVDAMVTEKPDFIPQNFMLVERKIRPEQALEFENKIKALQEEIVAKELESKTKLDGKKAEIQAKLDELKTKLLTSPDDAKTIKKCGDLEQKLLEVEPDKTIAKGIESRKKEIEEIQKSLDVIKNLADKQQVTASIWENAEQTALALKTHPSYTTMEFNEVTSQQIFTAVIDGIPRKGKLDHLKLSPALTRIYAIWKAGQITLEEMQSKIRELNPNDLWAIITDIKTCKSVQTLEPYNTHYRGQLGFYQDLVSYVLLIPIQNIRCRILVADKMSNEFKLCELFQFTQAALDELKPDVYAWLKIWHKAMLSNNYLSSKQKLGMKQTCFTCSDCRFCPLSTKPGEPVIIDQARFSGDTPAPIAGEISTADLVLDY